MNHVHYNNYRIPGIIQCELSNASLNADKSSVKVQCQKIGTFDSPRNQKMAMLERDCLKGNFHQKYFQEEFRIFEIELNVHYMEFTAKML